MSAPVEDMVIITKKRYAKTIEKNFDIVKNGEVAILNKYGNIDMNTWDKNKVQITVDIVVNATSESVAEDVFESININFDASKSKVYAETEIESKNNYWWNWSKNLKSDFEINYTVYMPITCSVNFDNKYGSINMMDLENDATISVKYGDLTMGDLEGDLQLILGYGNAFIGSVKDFDAEIKYSKMRCDYTESFTGSTKYSGLTINNAEKVVVESKYDNYNFGYIKDFVNEGKYDNIIIDQVDNLTIETKYTDVKIGKLNASLAAELNYGGIKVKELSKKFDRIFVESSYAGISLYPEKGTKFELNMEGKYVEVTLPENGEIKEDKDGSDQSINARYNGGGKAKMYFEMEYGFLKIQE